MQKQFSTQETVRNKEKEDFVNKLSGILGQKDEDKKGNFMGEYRVGHGYDVHKLCENRKLIIGGVDIPYEKGLLGHSDADVLLHAVMDALLGAAALGDIGKLFPDTDKQYEGADSLILTGNVGNLLIEKGYRILNVDATILAQRPKMLPYITDMRRNIAKALGTDTDRISVKATTEEGLGFTGRQEGIAAHAVCMIEKINF